MTWDTFYDPHPPTLMMQYPKADIMFFVLLTSKHQWVGWGWNYSRAEIVHMNGRFVNLTRITSNKS